MPSFKLVICALLLSACTNPASEKIEEQPTSLPDVKLPANFYKKLKGRIGEDLYITMDLIKRRDSVNKANTLNGSYYYDKIGVPIDLYGTVNDSGMLVLRETDNKGETTATFKGKFISENEATGTWTHVKTNKQYEFALKTDEAGSDKFLFSEYYNENCKAKQINMQSTRKDTLNWLDTMCCSVHISLVTLADANDPASKKINEAIVRNLLNTGMSERPPASIQELLHSIDDYGVGDILEAEYSANIVSNEGNILSLDIAEWENSGGAHPNGVSYYLNFNKRTGDTISLLDIVKPETIDELVYRARQQFIKENGALGKDSEWFFGEEFAMPKTFSIGKGGLLFAYQPYEAGPYAAGMPQFFLSWKQLKDIVRPEYLK